MFTHPYERIFVSLFYQVLSTSAHKAIHRLGSNADDKRHIFSMKMIKDIFLKCQPLVEIRKLKNGQLDFM